MANKTVGLATKGSRFMMQMAVSPLQKKLQDIKLRDSLLWLSPIEADNYQEYQLRSPKALQFIGMSNSIKKEFLSEFWPTKGRHPEWDGIAIGTNGTLYLVEAKSHFGEVKTAAPDNAVISNTLEYTYKKITNSDSPMPLAWKEKYYQFANRLCFLIRLNEFIAQGKLPSLKNVKMVFMNFIGDYTMEEYSDVPSTEKEWDDYYTKQVYPALGVTPEQLQSHGVVHVNYLIPQISISD